MFRRSKLVNGSNLMLIITRPVAINRNADMSTIDIPCKSIERQIQMNIVSVEQSILIAIKVISCWPCRWMYRCLTKWQAHYAITWGEACSASRSLSLWGESVDQWIPFTNRIRQDINGLQHSGVTVIGQVFILINPLIITNIYRNSSKVYETSMVFLGVVDSLLMWQSRHLNRLDTPTILYVIQRFYTP